MKAPIAGIAPLIVASLLLASPAPALHVNQPVEFETIAKYLACGHAEKKNYVIANKEDWERLWEKVTSNSYPRPAAPDVDFSKQDLIAVFQGVQPSSGYSISVTRLVKSGKKLKVYVREVSPGDECRVLLVITQPFEIIRTDKIEGVEKVVFKVKREVTACQQD
ncbi:MAG TPA: protease complex subunit PrcB family protein [Blastocatellia bacterium]|nr:protease complex subunit PrcB family protein [Blastocatellia bacterium]